MRRRSSCLARTTLACKTLRSSECERRGSRWTTKRWSARTCIACTARSRRGAGAWAGVVFETVDVFWAADLVGEPLEFAVGQGGVGRDVQLFDGRDAR